MENPCSDDNMELSRGGDGFVASYMHDIKADVDGKSEYEK